MIRNGLAFTTFVTIVLAALLLTPGSAIAAGKTPLEKLNPVDVLNNGFYKIKNFSTGDLSATPLTYGPGKVDGWSLQGPCAWSPGETDPGTLC